MKSVDLRSDTVTQPTEQMRRVMAEAAVGDDVFGDDPTVNRLEQTAAGILGTETAIFAPSGTQTNLLALLSHCGRGDEYIVGQTAHTYRYEAGGAAVLGSIQPQPLDLGPDGCFNLDKVAQVIKPDDFHFARSRLLCLENTYQGLALPLGYLERAQDCARKHGLSLHLDGARIFNAAVKSGVDVTRLSAGFDTVSVCLSKGLGAPVGSVLCGTEALIQRARRWRKMLGGGMRQAGIIAAAGLFALEHHVQRLQEDHDNAQRLAAGLSQIEGFEVEYAEAQTNMVFVTLPEGLVGTFVSQLAEHGILVLGGKRVRLVTHLGIGAQDIDYVVERMQKLSW
ncbi:MAG: low-specificity L-threonine aldolase [Desulfocapsaceae bacterium]